jgi:transposase
MLSLPLPVKIFWCLTPADMRRSFDGLAQLVEQEMKLDPLSGHLFIFCSRRRDRLKLLYFERGGMAIWYKRLEEGTFAAPRATADGHSLQLSAAELAMLLDGVELDSVKRRTRYERRDSSIATASHAPRKNVSS